MQYQSEKLQCKMKQKRRKNRRNDLHNLNIMKASRRLKYKMSREKVNEPKKEEKKWVTMQKKKRAQNWHSAIV